MNFRKLYTLGLTPWNREQGVRVLPARAPPGIADRVIEPCFDLSRPAKADDPFPDYDTEPVMAYANG